MIIYTHDHKHTLAVSTEGEAVVCTRNLDFSERTIEASSDNLQRLHQEAHERDIAVYTLYYLYNKTHA